MSMYKGCKLSVLKRRLTMGASLIRNGIVGRHFAPAERIHSDTCSIRIECDMAAC